MKPGDVVLLRQGSVHRLVRIVSMSPLQAVDMDQFGRNKPRRIPAALIEGLYDGQVLDAVEGTRRKLG